MTAPRFGMVAGEASGDLLAGLLLGGLRARWPDLAAQGIGGPKMAAQGFEAWWPHDKLAVRGYVEVLSHYRELAGIRNQLAERLPQLVRQLVALHADGCQHVLANLARDVRPAQSVLVIPKHADNRPLERVLLCFGNPRALRLFRRGLGRLKINRRHFQHCGPDLAVLLKRIEKLRHRHPW
jgi:hypothetical protein